jgi:type I restriction enzyme, R subunit
LADQAFNAFQAFDDDALTRISPVAIRKKGRVPKNASVFFTIFQTFMSGRDENGMKAPYFGEYPRDFFDFIIIDECHRGGANDESSWRGIMEYFSPATQLGLTATPKRSDNADTYRYFGDPVYVYSLKEGINDGYLTPFRVIQYGTSIDEYTYTPDDDIVEGEIDENHIYRENDFNSKIVITERERYRVELFMNKIDQRHKTLVFCANQEHAAMVRDLINETKTDPDPDYCHRVTANDLEEGELWLRKFQDNEKTIPTILTTSKKLSTGVDARNVRNIVLMRPVKSMVEFKQIVGRGTRLYDDKDHFTIHDFTKASEHFHDKEWDGEAEEVVQVGEDDREENIVNDNESGYEPDPADEEKRERPRRVLVKLAPGKELKFEHFAATSFYSPDGKPISAEEYIRQLYGELPRQFQTEEELRALWANPETRRKLLDALAERGFSGDNIAQISRMMNASDADIFDVLAYIAFSKPPVSRKDRVNKRKAEILSRYTDNQRAFLEYVLDQYVKVGVTELDGKNVGTLLQIKYGSISDAVAALDKKPDEIGAMFSEFQRGLYLTPPS